MTKKEQAAELVKSFEPYVYPFLGSGMLTNTEDSSIILKNAKICASISLNDQIRFIEEEMVQVNYDLRKIWIDELVDVRNEIEKL